MQLAEILDNILEQLAPKQQHRDTPYTPKVQQTLSACLSVSRQVHYLAAERLFRTLHVKSSIDPRHLDILLGIIEPSQEWMSIRPFIQNLIFFIDSSVPVADNSAVVHSFRSDHFVSLFTALSISGGNYGSRIMHFEFRASGTLLFHQAFERAVLRFVKLPTLQSLEIRGRFFTRDFLLGTHVHDVGISGYGIDLNLESNDLYTEELGVGAEVASGGDEQLAYPTLQRFKTDLVWPEGLPGRALDFIFRDLARLSVDINISHAFSKAEVLIKKTFSTLTTLIITYNFDGYEAELPTAWSIDFGELRSLQTLEFNWNNSLSSVHQNTIVKGCRPLAGLHSLLDTIGTPMRSLTTIRWNFHYLATSLPPDILSQWLQSDVRWRKLDELLASDLFPSLRFASLHFSPIAVFSRNAEDSDRSEDNDRLTIVSIDFDLVQSIVSENRQSVFPSLTASLGDNFRLKAAVFQGPSY